MTTQMRDCLVGQAQAAAAILRDIQQTIHLACPDQQQASELYAIASGACAANNRLMRALGFAECTETPPAMDGK